MAGAMTAPQPAVVDMQMQPRTGGVMAMIERVSSIPGFDPTNLEKLVELHERAVAREARLAFYSALTAAQSEMRPIAADATNPQTKSRYATYAALDNKLRPLYNQHGFGLSFNTADSPLPEHVRVLCSVTHVGGHEATYQVDMPCDGKGARGGDVMTKTHAAGAAMSYGMRYLLKMIFNVSVGEDDRDGNRPQDDKPAPVAPKGFQDFLDNMKAAADNGYAVFSAAWKAAQPQHRTFATDHHKDKMTDLRLKAQDVDKAAK